MDNNEELANPKSATTPVKESLGFFHSKSSNNFYSTKPIKVPSFEQIVQMSGTLMHSKKLCPETFPSPPEVKSQREIKLPRINLINTQKGINKPCWYPESEEEPLSTGAKRYTARPNHHIDSTNKIFPTVSLKFYQMPTTTSERFSEINPKEDVQLANFAVNSKNAFRTEWLKYKDLKNRKFNPEKHPEFIPNSKENNIKRDKIVNYREAMLKVKAMMNQAWGVKK